MLPTTTTRRSTTKTKPTIKKQFHSQVILITILTKVCAILRLITTKNYDSHRDCSSARPKWHNYHTTTTEGHDTQTFKLPMDNKQQTTESKRITDKSTTTTQKKLEISAIYKFHWLQMAYNQSVHLLAFKFGSRTFAYLWLAQGLNWSLLDFSSTERKNQDALVKADKSGQYVDDIGIAALNVKDLFTNMEAVFQQIQKRGLKLSMSKCKYQPHHLHKTLNPNTTVSTPKILTPNSTDVRWTADTHHQLYKGSNQCAQSADPGTRYWIKTNRRWYSTCDDPCKLNPFERRICDEIVKLRGEETLDPTVDDHQRQSFPANFQRESSISSGQERQQLENLLMKYHNIVARHRLDIGTIRTSKSSSYQSTMI